MVGDAQAGEGSHKAARPPRRGRRAMREPCQRRWDGGAEVENKDGVGDEEGFPEGVWGGGAMR